MKVKVIYFLVFLIIYLEMIFKFIVLKSAKVMDVAYTLLFSIQIILVLNLLCNAFKPKVSKVILMITTIVLTIYFMFQSVFYNLFSVPFSFMTLGLAENALDFTEMVKDAIIQNGFILILLSIPFWVLLFLQKKIDFVPFRKEQIAMRIAGIAFFLLILLGVIQIDQKGIYSTYNLFYNLNAQEKNMERFGLINSTVIDLTRTITGFEENLVLEVNSNEIEQTPEANNQDEPQEPEEVVVTYNELDLGLDALIEQTTDKNLKSVYQYIASVSPTNQNEYTGYFKDKNLIFILAEGFNSIAVDQELTPTLYRLTNSGFVFENFYSPVFLSTTGGEFQASTGLIPTQNILSLWKKNLPTISYGLGNSFTKQGYTANAYHNWTYTYYDRQNTMKTLGFSSYMGMGNGLEKLMSNKWIPSDVDMMKVTTDFYTSEDKFVTYYITVSGHAPYNFGGGNSTALRYRNEVKDLPYSTAVKAYLASQMELDRALEVLIQDLEEKGILEDTVIALVGDHYPYTLSIDDINQISTYQRDSIVEVNRSNFILWNSEMEEPVKIEKVGSQIDVLPTLLNLFGIEYDSRLIIGQDILSDNPGVAIFSNRSWVSDYGTYFASQKQFVPKGNTELDSDYVEKMNQSVANKFTMSQSFLKYDIYTKLVK